MVVKDQWDPGVSLLSFVFLFGSRHLLQMSYRGEIVKSKIKPAELYLNAIPLQAATAPTSHRGEKGRAKAAHSYTVGQTLNFSPNIFEPATRQGSYRIVRLLPSDSGDNQYRVMSESDGHERVVQESQLSLE